MLPVSFNRRTVCAQCFSFDCTDRIICFLACNVKSRIGMSNSDAILICTRSTNAALLSPCICNECCEWRRASELQSRNAVRSCDIFSTSGAQKYNTWKTHKTRVHFTNCRHQWHLSMIWLYHDVDTEENRNKQQGGCSVNRVSCEECSSIEFNVKGKS